MTSLMYTNSVPVFKQLLTALKAILAQADAHVAANAIEPNAFLEARLYPDMFPLIKQVQIAADFARGISARLSGVDVPVYEGNEKTFADLDVLLAKTMEFLESLSPAKFAGSETIEIVLRHGQKPLIALSYWTSERLIVAKVCRNRGFSCSAADL